MRIHTIDACLQRRNRLWTIDDLVEACEDALYEYEGITEISTRTIRRDLALMRSEKLGYNAPIIVRDRKYYTYEDPEYSITRLPLSDHDLAELSSALDIIRHYSGFRGLAGQEDIITRMQDKVQNLEQAHARVVYLETNTGLKGIDLLGTLYEHVVNRRPLAIRYQSFVAKRPSVQHISPYILKEFNNRWFVIGRSHEGDKILTLALDRIIAIDVYAGAEFIPNTFFDPELYLGQMVGVSRDLADTPQEVRIVVDHATAPYMLTKPLHPSQQVVNKNEDGSVLLSIVVIVNNELERLILGFGAHIEVLTPPLLRERIAWHFRAAGKIYEKK